MTDAILVVMPTYNEKLNIASMIERLRNSVPAADILIVDDNSPDGTGEIADEIASLDSHVYTMHRPGKLGLGTAYIQGFTWGLDRQYSVLVEMDADGSHRPEELPLLLRRLAGNPHADLVIGSRWVPGGRVVDWPKRREILSRGGGLYTRTMLGLHVKDMTAGFRAYRAEILPKIRLDSVASHGYCFQVDMTWRVIAAGGTVAEVPIVFKERQYGKSKMSGTIVTEALWRVTLWGFRYRFDQLRGRGRRLDATR